MTFHIIICGFPGFGIRTGFIFGNNGFPASVGPKEIYGTDITCMHFIAEQKSICELPSIPGDTLRINVDNYINPLLLCWESL